MTDPAIWRNECGADAASAAMTRPPEDTAFARFAASRDPAALAAVFDATAPKLLLVAMHLCGDAAAAEDLVQTVFLQAIRDAGTYDAARPVLPWLLAILEHRASDLRRSAAARRVRTGGDLATFPAAGAPDRDAADAEVRQRIADALDALPPNYRDVLTLRLVHGLRAVDIAHAQGQSPETVRTRLRRGLELLRRALPRSFAPPALLALLGAESLRAGVGLSAVRARVLGSLPAAAGAAVLGGVALAKWLGGAAAVLAALLAGSWLWPAESAAPGQRPGGDVRAARAELGDQGTRTLDRDAPSAAERREVAAVDPRTTVIHGRVLAAETGAPLAGAKVALCSYVSTERGGSRLDPAPRLEQDTAVDGSFSFAFAPAPTFDFECIVTSPGRTMKAWYFRSLRSGIDLDAGDCALARGTDLRFEVVDERDRPLPHVNVILNPAASESRERGWQEAWSGNLMTTDAAGCIAWPTRPPGGWSYELRSSRGGDLTGTLDVPLRDAPLVQRFVLRRPPPERCVSGTVRDTTGAPVGELEVVIPWGTRGILTAITDGNGEFLFGERVAPPDSERFHLHLQPSRLDLELIDGGSEFAWGANDLRVVVRRKQTTSLVVEVVDAATGEPIVHFAAKCVPDPWRTRYWNFDTFLTEPIVEHEYGMARFEALAPGPCRITVTPPPPYAERGELPIELQEGGEQHLRVAVGPPAALQVDVLDAATRQPCPGVRVTLGRVLPEERVHDTPLEGNCIRLADMRRGHSNSSGTNVIGLATATTDGNGHAVVNTAADTPALFVFAEGDRIVSTHVADVALPRSGNTLQVLVPGAACLHGRATPAALVARFAPESHRLPVEPFELPEPDEVDEFPYVALRRPGEELHAATAHVAADGTFRFAAVPAGSYEVSFAMLLGNNVVRLPPSAVVQLVAGRDTEVNIDLAALLPGRIHAQYFVDGEPWHGVAGVARLRDGKVDAWILSPGPVADSTDWLLPGRYVPIVELPIAYGRVIFGTEEVVLPQGGDVDAVFHLQRRRLEVRLLDADGKPAPNRGIVLEPIDHPGFDGGVHSTLTDDDGTAACDAAPPGRLRIMTYAPGEMLADVRPSILLGEVSADATAATVRLPR
jgi:RNA polymerase sigma-70 factor (ECF subfamily)